MSERFESITPVLVNYDCDSCNIAMTPAGVAYMTNPPRYPYVCRRCGRRETLNENYPVVRWMSASEAYLAIKNGEAA